MLKSGLKSMLSASNDLVSGLSSKLEAALSLHTDDEDDLPSVLRPDTIKEIKPGQSILCSNTDSSNNLRMPSSTGGETSPSEHPAEMFLFGPRKLRFPNFRMALSFEDYTSMVQHHKKRKDSTTSGRGDAVQSVSKQEVPASQKSDSEKKEMEALDFVVPPSAPPDLSPTSEGHASSTRSEVVLKASGPDPYDKFNYKTEAPESSGSLSEGNGYGPSTSLESDGGDNHQHQMWARSGSDMSLLSWASSLSCEEGQFDENSSECVAFMRAFVGDIFQDSTAITLDRKAKFGEVAQLEVGRLWFSRLVNANRASSKCVTESTFYGLIQYFAIILFECLEADDFSPAKSLMNMCFTFYHEVEVPGLEPYKEYLCTYLKDHPIWNSLRFWNAAFFDALQCERAHKPVVTREDVKHFSLEAITDEQRYQENITFGQLGTFTCNMHAFGLSKELCLEFLRKQCTIANLQPEQEKMLMENIERMYQETDPWR